VGAPRILYNRRRNGCESSRQQKQVLNGGKPIIDRFVETIRYNDVR
jgi:hypothetical protein